MSIKINLKIFLFAILFYMTKQIQLYALLMLFALLHELGHLVCGLAMGLKPKSLKIFPLGVCVEFSVISKDYNKKCLRANLLTVKKMVIALAGPLINVLIMAVAILLQNKVAGIDFSQIVYANALIAIFNLLPIYPLDGGRCIKGILKLCKGNKIAIRHTNILSNTCIVLLTAIASIAVLYYKNIAIVFIIAYLWYLTIIENKKYHTKMRIYEIIENERILNQSKEMFREEAKIL